MSQFLHNNDEAEAVAIPWISSKENSRAKKLSNLALVINMMQSGLAAVCCLQDMRSSSSWFKSPPRPISFQGLTISHCDRIYFPLIPG